jgi:PAS domain-containing protein
MVDSDQSNEETKQLQASVLKTATSVFQIRQRAEQEIRRTNEVLEARTRELAQALEILRATLESTTDSIMVTDEKGKVTNFNQQYIEMWKIPLEILEGGIAREVRKFASQSFADPRRFVARIEEIVATNQETFDLLELKDGRILERFSKVLTVQGQRAAACGAFAM